ncbi:MAG: hypothetical protein WAW54_10520 [Parvibaculum sedimenti]|uniref:hypothetical protein n=1 Tax=Parvibaculum sedimenti TaxID=2608632 RepID=UPI003BB4BBA2
MALGVASFATVLAASSAFAQDTAPSESAGQAGHKVYELKDEADSPPVNNRSDQDPRYDTKAQHDAEMYADQYKMRRQEEEARRQKLLNSGNKIAPGGQRGSVDDGFPPRSSY